jgi:hypothetical protein
MITELTARFAPPPVADVFLPPFHRGGQPKDAQFMALRLEGGATGISYLLLPDEAMEEYTALTPPDFVGREPAALALDFGSDDPVRKMIGLGAVNAVCQHVMKETRFPLEPAPDPFGLLAVAPGDRIGMVGLFAGLAKAIRKAGAELVVLEKKEHLMKRFPELPITLDPSNLKACNKVLCTGTTLLNDTLEEVLSHCAPGAFVSIIGPTAGYFPDPLFARGVAAVGGRVVTKPEEFLKRLAERNPWGDTTRPICFLRETYAGIP